MFQFGVFEFYLKALEVSEVVATIHWLSKHLRINVCLEEKAFLFFYFFTRFEYFIPNPKAITVFSVSFLRRSFMVSLPMCSAFSNCTGYSYGGIHCTFFAVGF
jgi:hypothetical protein